MSISLHNVHKVTEEYPEVIRDNRTIAQAVPPSIPGVPPDGRRPVPGAGRETAITTPERAGFGVPTGAHGGL
ncbi:hypothetical protein [Rhodococcus kronopolitis]|uniref:Uncharacterized protein n=1 Tax=Rhodococcus kronopolitis TaxID=1460226 RepID=A0ABV9FPP0_9NOCA